MACSFLLTMNNNQMKISRLSEETLTQFERVRSVVNRDWGHMSLHTIIMAGLITEA